MSDTVTPMSREARLLAHSKRIEVGELVEKVREEIDSGLEIEELRAKLEEGLETQRRLKTKLLEQEDEVFQKLLVELQDVQNKCKCFNRDKVSLLNSRVAMQREIGVEIQALQDKIEALRTKRANKDKSIEDDLNKIREKEKPFIALMYEKMGVVEDYCLDNDASADDYLEIMDNLISPARKPRPKVVTSGMSTMPGSWFPPSTQRTWAEWKQWVKDKEVTMLNDRSGVDNDTTLNGLQAFLAVKKCDLRIPKWIERLSKKGD